MLQWFQYPPTFHPVIVKNPVQCYVIGISQNSAGHTEISYEFSFAEYLIVLFSKFNFDNHMLDHAQNSWFLVIPSAKHNAQ